ncbi:MAG TPA: CPBP family intramembrane metalloprotease [Thermodesulfobacteriota bacterium]|mgnify:CR=1 FL=1|nr:CPBP family intramembrane metalloprotease [Thermodesulfobacteriota bacterium]
MRPYGKSLLLAEFFVLFTAVPALIVFLRERWLMIALLWGGSMLAYVYLRKTRRPDEGPRASFGEMMKRILLRFAVIAPLVTILVWTTAPDDFLSFPRENPRIWILVMALYPLLSVWPQEILYRALIYKRYAPVFGEGRGYLIASALAFGYMHIIFLNWIAVVMTLVGGFIFADNYRKRRSLALVSIEHALYGCLIFTVGLGRFFYVGAAWG